MKRIWGNNRALSGTGAIAFMVLGALALSACDQTKAVYPEKGDRDTSPTWGDKPRQTIFGEGGLSLGGEKKKGEETTGIGVNAYLWRASIDTLGFMPLMSADAFGGVILTDWYAPPESPSERFKMTVLILDRALRADGIKVSVFRQVRDPSGNWVDAPVDAQMSIDMENSILTRARQLRISGSAE